MSHHRARIRMYRHGLGDCHLIRLPRPGQADYSILIDCGIILGTRNARGMITKVMDDVTHETGGVLDLLVVTHAHGDHVSGFLQAEAAFEALTIKAVWMAWTENPEDAFAQSLVAEKHRARVVVEAAETQMRAGGDDRAAEQVAGIMDFFGVGSGRRTTEDAVQVARDLAPDGGLRYCEPGQPAFRPDGVAGRILVLGPPRDARLIRKSSPSSRAPETFEAAGYAMFMRQLGPLADQAESGRPFSSLFTIPTQTAKNLPFFRQAYWTGPVAEDAWRGIDALYADSAVDLALKLDGDTNNTSLVLAIELDGDGLNGDPGRDVLLFAGDAQVGNWLSWEAVVWPEPEPGEAAIDGADLVRRTLVYKVGHHGSHNATLKAPLERMERLLIALNPVDEAMAEKKRWAHIPLPSLEAALKARSSNRLVRADRDGPAEAAPWLTQTPLYHEVTV